MIFFTAWRRNKEAQAKHYKRVEYLLENILRRLKQ